MLRGGEVGAEGMVTMSAMLRSPETKYKCSKIIFPVTCVALTSATYCSKLLEISAQFLIGSPGTLQLGPNVNKRCVQFAPTFFWSYPRIMETENGPVYHWRQRRNCICSRNMCSIFRFKRSEESATARSKLSPWPKTIRKCQSRAFAFQYGNAHSCHWLFKGRRTLRLVSSSSSHARQRLPSQCHTCPTA